MLNNIHPIMLLVLWVRNSDTWKMARVSSVMSGASVGKIWTAGGWNHLGASALVCLVPELSWLKDQVQLGLLTRVPTHDSFMRYTVGWPQIVRLLTELQEWVFQQKTNENKKLHGMLLWATFASHVASFPPYSDGWSCRSPRRFTRRGHGPHSSMGAVSEFVAVFKNCLTTPQSVFLHRTPL